MDSNDNILTDHSNIEHAFTDFYLNLWSDSSQRNFDEILHALPSDFNNISSANYDFLIREVSKNEIYKTLISFPSGKSHRLDGINAEFYRLFWNKIGDKLFSAVNFFFKNSVILKT